MNVYTNVIINQYTAVAKGSRTVTLEMLIDFENRKVTGDVVVKYHGEKRRFRCEDYAEATYWYGICKEWADGDDSHADAIWEEESA